ncbi:MAG: hypothetical protein GEU83_13860 [Pseudonocardiaceae bacterium]|nr:hypothetical protein [Pseudonocardiaceae bacterium]
MIVLATVTAAAALLLIRTGIDHLHDPATLARVLAGPAARGVAGRRLRAARAVAVVELLVGAAVLCSLALGPVLPTPLLGTAGPQWLLATQGLLYLGFTASLWSRYRRGDQTDCGCTALPAVVGPAALARAAGLSLASLLAALVAPATTALDSGPAGLVLVAVGAGVLAALLHALPAAIDGLPTAQPGRAA